MQTLEFNIYGMRCGNCATRVQLGLSKLDGIDQVKVTLRPGHATVQVEPGRATSKTILAAIIRFGYLAKMDASKQAEQDAA